MVRNSTIFFPFPAPITVSASPARFASFSNCTEIPVIFSNSFVSSKLCHPGRFGGVKIIPLIKSNGPGQEIPIPSIFSPNPLITSLIWFNVFIGFFGSDPNWTLSLISYFSLISATLVFVPPTSIPTAYFMIFFPSLISQVVFPLK